MTGKLRVSMLLLLGTVGFVLLMACANVANLQLARAVARQREIAVRVALGAGAYRLMRQLLTEGFVLAAMGGMVGLPLAYAGIKLLIAVGPEGLIHAREIRLDGRALLFTSAAVLACAVLAGLPLAWRMVRAEMGVALRKAGRGLAGGHHRVRAALVSTQVAVALVLLVGAGLLVRSFLQLLDVNPGFDANNVVTISTQMPAAASTPALRAALYRTIRDKLMAVPGVVNVGAVSRLPMMGKNLGSLAFIEGKSVPGQPGFDVEYRVATPSYFATMGIPLRAGRYFDEHDDANPAAVLLINETMARKYWPGESAVGKRLKLSSTPERAPWITVVGVVGDVRHFAHGYRAAGGGVPAVRGESAGRADPGDPHEHGRGGAQEHVERGGARRGRGDPDLQRVRDAGIGGAVHRAAAVCHAAAGRVRAGRAAAGRCGDLWNGVAGGGAEDAGDRRADGVGRASRRGAAPGVRRGTADDGSGSGGRRGGGGGPGVADAGHAV